MARLKGIVTLIGYQCSIIRKIDGAIWESQVVGETSRSVLIRTQKGLKKITKVGHIFKIKSNEGVWVAEGEDLLGRPVNRLKKKRHAWQKRK